MKKSPTEIEHSSEGTTRREFLAQAAVATSAMAVAGSLPSAFAQTTDPDTGLKTIGEIVSKDGKLKGVIRITNATKNVPGWTTRPMMRYFEGYDQQTPSPVWPPDKNKLMPGPTLRVKVGERVELTLINNVKVDEFAGSLDQAETGATDGCDQATNTTVDPPNKTWYPNTRGDTYPNCYHGSSSSNLHFHGTHVTPDSFGDNVLINVRPNPLLKDDEAASVVEDVFTQCAATDGPLPWAKVPDSFRKFQEAAVKNYDLTAIWKGVRGPVVDTVTGEKKPALPYENQLAPVNEHNIGHVPPLWPQYFIGVYPTCFKVTEADGHKMGQAPGTHWYHGHKHGSTALNLFNGMAGAMIIEGEYDEDLEKIPNLNLKDTEKVLVVQQFTDLPDLERPTARSKPTLTNGSLVQAKSGSIQTAPAITMQPGEIQLWRIVNATAGSTITTSFKEPSGATKVLPSFRQIAQDGVQFNLANYNGQPLTGPTVVDPVDGKKNGTAFQLAPGGRIDLLVKAPNVPAKTTGFYELTGIVNLTVKGDPVQPAQNYPTDAQFPTFPPFLADVGECKIKRTVTFGWEPYRVDGGTAASQTTHATYVDKDTPQKLIDLPKNGVVVNPDTTIDIKKDMAQYFTIDDEQFHEDKFYKTLVLDDEEEWTIYNTTNGTHPYHIHVNPFQIVEIFDPNTNPNPIKIDTPLWWDVFNIPAAKTTPMTTGAGKTINAVLLGPDNKATTPGYIKIRSRFVDFAGTFVLHCHILDHEDRGMMQLVRVIDGKTPIKHH